MKIKKVTSQEEYDRELKKYKKKINKLFRNSKQMLSDPKKFITDYENLLLEMEQRGIISKEYRQKKLQQFYKEMSMPTKFKSDIKEVIEKTKNKLMKKRK